MEKGIDPVTKENKTGITEWPMFFTDMVVDEQKFGAEEKAAGICRLKYDRLPGGEPVLMCISRHLQMQRVALAECILLITTQGLAQHCSSIIKSQRN